MGWLSKQKYYNENVMWYCPHCKELTKVELNPLWLAAGKPYEWDSSKLFFDWFARCSCCESEIFNLSYCCDNCGYSDHDEGFYYFEPGSTQRESIEEVLIGGKVFADPQEVKTLRERGIKIYPIFGSQSSNYDGSLSWDETHYCPYCKQEYSFVNGT